jgi:hypothetical protein
MDVLQEKNYHDINVTIEKLHVEAELAATAKLDATLREKEVVLKLFLGETHLMT